MAKDVTPNEFDLVKAYLMSASLSLRLIIV